MKSSWVNFDVWKKPYAQRENQVQVICKPDSFVACVFGRRSKDEADRCLKLQKRYPKIKLVVLDVEKRAKCEENISYGRCIAEKSRGFQLVTSTS